MEKVLFVTKSEHDSIMELETEGGQIVDVIYVIISEPVRDPEVKKAPPLEVESISGVAMRF